MAAIIAVAIYFLAYVTLYGNRLALFVVFGGIPAELIIGCFIIPARYRTKIYFDMDVYVGKKWEEASKGFYELSKSNKKWFYAVTENYVRERTHGGANRTFERESAEVSFLQEKEKICSNLIANVKTVCVYNKNRKLIFTPIGVIVTNGLDHKMCPYHGTTILTCIEEVVEHETVPKDAVIVRLTWQNINVDGTADARFKNNRQLPVCKYGKLIILDSNPKNSYLLKNLMTSNTESVEIVKKAFEKYQLYVGLIVCSGEWILKNIDDKEKIITQARESFENEIY